MFKPAALLLCATFFLASCGDSTTADKKSADPLTNTESEAPAKYIDGLEKKDDGQLFTGVRKSYYKDDRSRLMAEVSYVNGLRNGKAIDYYKNGKIRLEGYYKEGDKHGEFKWYYENGNLYQRTGFANDDKHGWDSLFYKSGYHQQAIPYEYGNVLPGTIEWNKLHKVVPLPPVKLRELNRIATEGYCYLFASTEEWVKDKKFEITMIGNGTMERPEFSFEPMVFTDDQKKEAMYMIQVPQGYEIAGKFVVRMYGKTKQGNPFVDYKVFPVVMR